MAKDLITSKITPDCLRMLRLVAALTGEKQYQVMQRLLEAEMRRLSLRVESSKQTDDDKPKGSAT